MAKSSVIKKLIENDELKVYFNPIISPRRKKMVGIEAEFEATINNRNYSYDELKKLAYKVDKMLDFEFFCYKKALKEFKKFCTEKKEFGHIVLFLEFESILIHQAHTKLGEIFSIARELNIHANSVAIEISEYKSTDINALREFTKELRTKGVLIGIDEIGSGYSNIESLTIVEPDIIKINISRINSISKEFYKIGLIKAMSSLAKSLGSLMCCKKVESATDALLSIDSGADLLQGKLFYCRERDGELSKDSLDSKIETLTNDIKVYMDCKFNRSNNLLSELSLIASKMAYELTLSTIDEYEKKMRQFLKMNDSIECIFILNIHGIKITESIFAKGRRAKNRKSIFKPYHIGSDHSSKDFYFKVIRKGSGNSLFQNHIYPVFLEIYAQRFRQFLWMRMQINLFYVLILIVIERIGIYHVLTRMEY